MKVEQKTVPAMTLEQFAEKHGLTLQIKERALPEHDSRRFYASFKGCEVKYEHVLASPYGNGATPEEATANYAKELDLKRVVIDAYTPERREIPPHRITAD